MGRVEKSFVVYMATNTVNGKRYIGVTKHGIDFRKRQHLYAVRRGNNGCPIFSAAIVKYGADSFEWCILATLSDRISALEEEVRLIAEMKPEYNVTKGGDGASYPRTSEHRAKISRSLTGRKHPPHWKTRLEGVSKHSAETKLRLSEYGHARKAIFFQFQKLGPLSRIRKVVCLNTGEIYDNAKAAALAHGIATSLVREVCLRDPRRKTASGLVFRYFGDHHGGAQEAAKMLAERDAGRKIGGRLCSKPVICDTYGIRFNSAVAASIEFCIPVGRITDVCRGNRPHTFGLKFSYIGES